MGKTYDDRQLQVINFNHGYALVLGAPGCGKTDILSQRVLTAHTRDGIAYDDMLCLTFTNRAAREMRDRIGDVAGDVLDRLFVGNLHRFCIHFLHTNSLLPHDVGLLDETDLEDILEEIDWGHKAPSLWDSRLILDMAAAQFMQENGFPPELYQQKLHPGLAEDAKCYRRFKEEEKLIDFDDLLLLTLRALRSDERDDLQLAGYHWIQVDEVQDLNPLQLAIIDALAAPDFHSVVFLGDERQAIYSFIGAKRDSLTAIRQRAGANFFVLSNNYRSPMYLLDMLNNYAIYRLGVDEQLLPKTTNRTHLDDALMTINCAYDEQQREVIGQLCQRLATAGEESTAVLVRTNYEADLLSNHLDTMGIPHMKLSRRDSFKMVPFKTLYSHLSVVTSDTRYADWTRLLYQTRALDRLDLSRRFMRKCRQLALTPLDLMLYDEGSYVQDFCHSYAEREVVIFDTETTGLDIFEDDIIQIAAMKMRGGKPVHGSELDIIIRLDDGKVIPPTLHHGLINPMVEEYARRSVAPQTEHSRFMTAPEALAYFRDYVGDAELLGHNVNYDVQILEHNLRRRAPEVVFPMPKYWDTLKLSRLLDPNLRRHTLESLLAEHNLEGVNSHNALDDIRATKALTDYCYVRGCELRAAQQAFLSHPAVAKIRQRIRDNYMPLYMHTLGLLYSYKADTEHTLCHELDYIYRQMALQHFIDPIWNFDHIKALFDRVVINHAADRYFYHQLLGHLFELRSFNEGDFFQNGIVSDRLFVMTTHKSKGLEFDNVIVYDATCGRMPKANSTDINEDARVLYVAMSRARKRVFLTYKNELTGFISRYPEIKEHFTDIRGLEILNRHG